VQIKNGMAPWISSFEMDSWFSDKLAWENQKRRLFLFDRSF